MNKMIQPLSLLAVMVIVMVLSSCEQSTEKQDQLKASVIEGNDELLNKGNLDFADQLFAENQVAGIKGFVSSIRNSFPDLQVKAEPMVAEGNMVGWVRTCTGTYQGPFRGYMPNGKQVTWTDVVLTQYDDNGKIVQEWGASNMEDVIRSATNMEGIYTYVPPLRGQSIIKKDSYVFLYGSDDGSGKMTGESGTWSVSGDTIINKVNYSTNPDLIGTEYKVLMRNWSGDTVTYNILNSEGQVTGSGSAVRVKR